MAQNPYQSPKESNQQPTPPVELGRPVPNPHYPGGFLGVAFAGFVIGVLLMLAMSPAWRGDPPLWLNPFVIVGVGWFASLVGLAFLLKGQPISGAARWIAALVAFPVCYVLYVPTCTIGAIAFSSSVYGDEAGATLSSAICFPVIFLIAAVCIRASLRRRQTVLTEDEPMP